MENLRVAKLFKLISLFTTAFLIINMFLIVPFIQVNATSKIIIVPNDYLTIQAAIDAAEINSIIYVKAGKYFEHIVINKPLWLIGENPDTTIIDGQQIGATLTIKSNNTLLNGFTIMGGGVIGGLLGQGVGIALYNVANCTIINNRIIYNRMGVYLHSSSKTIISNNIIMNNREGIYLYNSIHNTIIKNDIIENKYFAIHLFSSNKTQIIRNNMINNSLSIYLYASSCNNTIIENNIIRSGDMIISTSLYNNISKNIFINNSLYVLSSYKNIIKDNIVNGKPIVCLEESSNYIIKEAGQVILINCKNITIENLELSNIGIGIELWQTNNTMIIKNKLMNNQIGIYLYASLYNNISDNEIMDNVLGLRLISSSNNNIFRNNIMSNGYGIVLEYSTYNNISQNKIMLSINYGSFFIKSLNNLIYNNEFIDNAEQVLSYESINIWDNGYPTGGNYWSNFISMDSYSGIKQNEIGSDGISDTQYFLDNENVDRYPLMKKPINMTTNMKTLTTIKLMNYYNELIITLGLILFIFIIYFGMKSKKKGYLYPLL